MTLAFFFFPLSFSFLSLFPTFKSLIFIGSRANTQPVSPSCLFLALNSSPGAKGVLPRIPRSSLLPPAGRAKKAPPTPDRGTGSPERFSLCFLPSIPRCLTVCAFLSVIPRFIFPGHQFYCTDKIGDRQSCRRFHERD